MSKLKKQFKKLEEGQKKYQKLVREQQAICPHVSKKGSSKLGTVYDKDGIKVADCKKCGATVIVDEELLNKNSVAMSAGVIKSALSELKARTHKGDISIDDETLKLISKFETEVLGDLPEFMEAATEGINKEKKHKKKHKKDKKKKKKENQRSRWM